MDAERGRRAWQAVVGLAMALSLAGPLCGCRTASRSGSTGESSAKGAEWSEEATEQRIRAHAHFGAARLAELNGDAETALEHYRQAALADPGEEGLVLQVAERLVRKPAPEEAIAFLRSCLDRCRAPASYYATLGSIYALQEQWDEAIAANRSALERRPTFLPAYRNLVDIHSQRRESELTLASIRDAARQTSLDPAYFIAVAEFLHSYGLNHPEEAEGLQVETKQLLDRALELKPESPLLMGLLAEQYRRLGENEIAKSLYEGLVERFPQERVALESLADLYLYSEDRSRAAELLENLLEIQPGHQRATYVLGSLAFQEGKLEEADELLSRALLLNRTLQPAYYQLAAVRLSLGRHEEALEILERSRQQFPDRTFLGEFYSGLAHMRAERWGAATRHFTEAEILAAVDEPDRLTDGFYFQFGAACERRGDYEGAAQQFRKCLELTPDFAEALNYLGYMWAEQGENLEEAKELIDRAVALEPENSAFLDSLGWVLFQLGEPEEALPYLEDAIRLVEEPDPTLFDHLGDVQEALGNLEEAREAWRRALELKPEDESIQEKLRRSRAE